MKKRRKNKLVVYLGWDGSYVLSPVPLRLEPPSEPDSVPFLSPVRGKCVDLEYGDMVFGALGLAKHEVARLEIKVTSRSVKRVVDKSPK